MSATLFYFSMSKSHIHSYITTMKKTKQPILVIDSGIGGLTVLYNLVLENPNCDYIYFADYVNSPYGDKSATFLRKKLIENIKTLSKKYSPQGVVLACNTATAVAAGVLRRVFSNDFIVGTEPAIMRAIHDNKKNILVLATPNTLKHNKLVNEQMQNENINLEILALPNLATYIEDNIDNLKLLKPIVQSYLVPFLPYIDALVLGCTHYIYLKPMLREILSTDIKIYDGNIGVAKQTHRKTKSYKNGRIYVITNDARKGANLISAWNLLVKDGNKICAE